MLCGHSWFRRRHLAAPILDEMSVSKRQMRQSNKRGNYFDGNADKTRTAIKPALVKLRPFNGEVQQAG
jgi:hypothetical protein